MSMDAELEIHRWENGVIQSRKDCVAQEAPLEIRINGESLTITMRTPGDDFSLTSGFLFAEGVIQSYADIETIGYECFNSEPDKRNLIRVTLKTENILAYDRAKLERNFISTSSCGICGKSSLEAVRCLAKPLTDHDFRAPATLFEKLSARMRASQSAFDKTGGLHAAALFSNEGEMLILSEDIGRHNAVDKLIGRALYENRLPLSSHILLVSGRTSFEILQKAAVARIPIVCAVSAPSSLAVELARELNITLIGFLRGDTMNIYSGVERIGA